MKISVFAVILLLVVSISCAPLSEEWESWKQMYGKKYTTKNEELKRQLIWLSNKKAIEEHNANKEKFGYTLKMNHFGDLVSFFNKNYNWMHIIIILDFNRIFQKIQRISCRYENYVGQL